MNAHTTTQDHHPASMFLFDPAGLVDPNRARCHALTAVEREQAIQVVRSLHPAEKALTSACRHGSPFLG
jgi:hypothetical protein